MLVFIDESGDPGLRLDRGSSQYFTVSLVVFEDNDDAVACDQRINLLRREIGWELNGEFHFRRNSHLVRSTFLKAVSPYNFFYYGIVINKDPERLYGEGFRNKESFYKYACRLVFENAKEKLHDATVVIDRSGNNDFRDQLSRYLKRHMNDADHCLIKKVKIQNSSANNLLQLADYIAGVINRSVRQQKKRSDDYRRIIAHREIFVQIWPK
jgi:hypothetical protein